MANQHEMAEGRHPPGWASAADLPAIHVPGAMRVETMLRTPEGAAFGPAGREEVGVQGQRGTVMRHRSWSLLHHRGTDHEG